MKARHAALATLLGSASGWAAAAGGDVGQVAKQPTNWIAIAMFSGFVLLTLYITKWAASKTKSEIGRASCRERVL